MLNLLTVQAGQTLQLKDGRQATVTENIGDGIWLRARLPEGDEDLVFCEDIQGLCAPAAAAAAGMPA